MRAAVFAGLVISLATTTTSCKSTSSEDSGPPAKFPYEHDARAIASEDLDVLEHADTLKVLRLSPETEKGANAFHDYAVTGAAAVSTGPARRALVDAVTKSIKDSDGRLAKCFDPHHAISATRGGKTVDLVMCFECSQLYVYGQRPSRIPISSKEAARLDQLFAESGLH